MNDKYKVSWIDGRGRHTNKYPTKEAADDWCTKVREAGFEPTLEEIIVEKTVWEQTVEYFKLYWKRTAIGFAAFLVLMFAYKTVRRAFIVVPTGSKAVIMVFGKASHIANDGLNFTWPWISTSRLLSTRVQKAVLKAEAVSKDQQKVLTEAAVQWTFKPEKLLETFNNVGGEDTMIDAIMMPALNEGLKAVTAKYPVGAILDNREAIKEEIDDKFRARVKDYHINILDVYLTNLRFEKEYEEAIEAKQVAEVNVKTAENTANAARKQAQGDADAALIRAEAEAKSKRLLSTTVSKAVLQLEWIKAWEKGGSKVPTFIGGGSSQFMLDMSKMQETVVVPAPVEEAK